MSKLQEILADLSKKSKEVKKENQEFFKKLKKRTPRDLDYTMQDLHDATFDNFDCLECANCCKTTSPIFTEKDITTAAKYLKMKEAKFMQTYLRRDEDDFWVLQSAPCAFLDEKDNTCTIYDARPKACAEYPHTNRKKFIQLTNLTMNNVAVCPAVYEIVEQLKLKLSKQ